MKKFYYGCIGIIPSDGPIEHVVLKAYWHAPDYLRTLPLLNHSKSWRATMNLLLSPTM